MYMDFEYDEVREMPSVDFTYDKTRLHGALISVNLKMFTLDEALQEALLFLGPKTKQQNEDY